MPCNGQCFTVIQIHNLEEIIVMKYIESLREGERINEIYLCKTKQSALTKAGKPYENVILQDKTGILDAKIWDPGSVGIDDFDSLDYVAVMGDITSFQGNLQLSIKRVRKVQEGEYDDNNIAELISLYLTKECFDTKIVNDGEEALTAFEQYNPNLILLDLMLPGIDGYQVCREVRAKANVPIIMLSAKGEIFDKVLGLELGADDYMMKPFDSKELVARVKAVLRRYQPVKTEEVIPDLKCVKYEDLVINLSNYSVIYMGQAVDMPPKELELLYFLASSPNQVFTREQLLDHIWGYEYIGDTRTVDVHVKRLREKIKDHANWSLATVWGIGYKFEVRD
jgi:two-component system, OmpR family, response regulator ResD